MPGLHDFTSENQPANNGRKVGCLSVKKIIQSIFNEEVEYEDEMDIKVGKTTINKNTVRLVKAVRKMVEKAEKGDIKAFKLLIERVDGMPKQQVDTNHSFQKMPMIKKDGEDMVFDIG